ncbi:hypothetical protein ILUMI_00632 [Ignelater luminosus]|uniref:Microtubule-associated protein Jupiter n=1 Tax=Ignelater luminosus TaxID=2038154 RepID=A0A8K0GL17_IGNLU|nr:hypothetical protein ILUMI_00632 [Ignelater luminosus]
MDEENAITKDETATELTKQSKTSIECLREARPYEDISIKTKIKTEATGEPAEIETGVQSNQNVSKVNENNEVAKKPSRELHGDSSKIETVFEKLDITTDKTDSTTDSTISGKDKEVPDVKETTSGLKAEIQSNEQSKVDVPPLNFDIRGRASEPKNDIISSNGMDVRRSTSSLYSVKGSPSGRINRRRDTSSNVFPVGCMGCKDNSSLDSPRRFLDANEASNDFIGHIDETPRKKQSAEKQDITRNPLTGEGIEIAPETRRQCIRRKDGNPLLGTGYETPANATPSGSSGRIPPGGYSKGLW